MHRPYGLMDQIVQRATANNVPVFRWCLWEVIERCPPQRQCHACPLWEDCRGVAKEADGYFPIDDAIAQEQRCDQETWETEMLCRRPSRRERRGRAARYGNQNESRPAQRKAAPSSRRHRA